MTTAPDLVRSRRAFDRTVLEAMVGPNLQVRAFSNAADLASGKGLDMGDGREARAYRVTIHQRTLTGPDAWSPTTVVAINTEVANYPVGEPMVWAESRPVPWSPHWSPTSGQFCMGPFWGIGKGKILLGQLVIHVARLLNWDEQLEKGYTGWNAAAVAKYWARAAKPLLEHPHYPVLPSRLIDPGRNAFAYTTERAHPAFTRTR